MEGEICSQFIKLTKEKILSPLICQQQHNNSFSLGKTNANNNSQDSGNGVVLKKGDFQLLAPSSLPFPKDTLPNYRNKWFILAHVSCRGSWDHTVWLVGQILLPVAIITKEVLFFKKRNIKWYIYLLLKTFCLLWKRLTLAARCQSKLAFNRHRHFYYFLHCP